MRNSVFAVLIVIFMCSMSYAQDHQKTQQPVQKYNKALDKAESAIRKKFGPAIVSITRDFRNASLVVEVDDNAMSKIRDSKKFRTPKIGVREAKAGPIGPGTLRPPDVPTPKVREYVPRPDNDITHFPKVEPAKSTVDQIKSTIKPYIPSIIPKIEHTPHQTTIYEIIGED